MPRSDASQRTPVSHDTTEQQSKGQKEPGKERGTKKTNVALSLFIFPHYTSDASQRTPVSHDTTEQQSKGEKETYR